MWKSWCHIIYACLLSYHFAHGNRALEIFVKHHVESFLIVLKRTFVFESYKKTIIIFTVYVVSGVPLFKVCSSYCLHHLRRLNLYWLPGYMLLLIFAILNRLCSWYLRDDVRLVDSNEGAGWDGKNQCKALSCSGRCHPRTLQEEWGTICQNEILIFSKPILGLIYHSVSESWHLRLNADR